MLDNQQIDRSPEWLEADEKNRSNQPRTITKNFNAEVERIRKLGFTYCPFDFLEQWQWIKSIFYTVSSGRDLQIKRLFPDGRPDGDIPSREVHAMLEREFGNKLHPLINDWAGYYIPSTAGSIYDPSTHDDFIDVYSTVYRNSYRPSLYSQQQILKTRPTHWQEYLDRLMPREHNCTDNQGQTFPQQDYFEAYIAQRLQQPSQPPLIAVLLRGEQGTGKNYWMDNIMRPLLGADNFVAVSLKEIRGQFISDLYSKLLVHVEEINDTRGKAAEKLKKLITEDTARTEAKGKDAKVVNKYFGIVASSNVQDPVRIEANDRRYFVPIYSTHLVDPDETKGFFLRFTEWLEKQGGLQELADYFYSLDIKGFSFRFPPHTADKQDITEVSTSAEDKITQAAMEIATHYDRYIFSVMEVSRQWHVSKAEAQKALLAAGFVSHKRRWTEGRNTRMWISKKDIPKDNDWSKINHQVFVRRYVSTGGSYNPPE